MNESNPAETAGESPESISVSDQGLSLEELSTAYAVLLQRGSSPYDDEATAREADDSAVGSSVVEPPIPADPSPSDDGCDLSPRSILEAMLFVGNGQNQPLTARQVAALMRGVRPQEIDELVQELNAEYAADGTPYRITSVDNGYLLELREEFAPLREVFYGRVKDARLTQQAIDVLAIVAYRQPMTREAVDKIRGRPCGSVLAQLVRRELLRIERSADNPKAAHYHTTDRFLRVFGLDSIEELPDSQDDSP